MTCTVCQDGFEGVVFFAADIWFLIYDYSRDALFLVWLADFCFSVVQLDIFFKAYGADQAFEVFPVSFCVS